MRTLLISVVFVCVAGAQLSAPVIGYVRDRAGALRPLSGVAGAFVLGNSVERDILTASFAGTSGCASTATDTIQFRNGRETARQSRDEAVYCPVANGVAIEGDEAVVTATGARLRLPAPVLAVEQMATEWFVLRAESALFALRITAGREAIYELPEAPAE